MLTWKIVMLAEASVLYIYIDYISILYRAHCYGNYLDLLISASSNIVPF